MLKSKSIELSSKTLNNCWIIVFQLSLMTPPVGKICYNDFMLKAFKSVFTHQHFKHTSVYMSGLAGMILLIPFVKNDYFLAVIYLVFIFSALVVKRDKADYILLTIGFFGLMAGEYLFIHMGVETFSRQTLLGVMPFWLPFLWAFIFLSMKRAFWLIIR